MTTIYIHPAWGPGKATKTTAHTFDVHQPGKIHLSRVPQDAILERARYEFFIGVAENGTPFTAGLCGGPRRRNPRFQSATP